MKPLAIDFSSHRAFSNKTRIKTFVQFFFSILKRLIEHFPTKQGLRLHLLTLYYPHFHSLIEHFPTKQGLRPLYRLSLLVQIHILIEHFPTKQGLRHLNFHFFSYL